MPGNSAKVPGLIQAVAFCALLLAASVTDIRSREIPYGLTIPLALTGLIDFSPVRLWGLLLAAPFFIASGFDRGGAGDVFLVAASCFVLGLPCGTLGLILALILFCLFYLAAVRIKKPRQQAGAQESYPLAPFLAAGFIAAYFIGG